MSWERPSWTQSGHRWVAALNAYNFTIHYRPGRANGDADGLSRRPDDTEYKCDICRVVYMSLWSSGQRELERREVLVLPPHDRVGWSFSLVWAFGESTRILIYVIRIVHKLPLKLIYVHYTTRNPAIVLITKIMYICMEL